MKKKTNVKNNITLHSIIFITVLALILLFIYANFSSSSSPASNSVQKTTQFISKDLKFSIQVNEGLQIEDKGISINLSNDKGQINIFRNGTQYADLDSYLSYFDKLRGVSSIKSAATTIDKYSSLKRLEKTTEGNRLAYYIMVENFVYTLSTSSEALYSDLDQIAQSFRYAP